MFPNSFLPPSRKLTHLTWTATQYPAFSDSFYSLATNTTLALIKDDIATQCGGDVNANNIDFFATDEYFTSGPATPYLPAWEVRRPQILCSREPPAGR